MRRGRVVMDVIESDVLAGNAAGDPATRTVPVYLPPGYDATTRRYPVIYVLSGFTGRGRMLLNDNLWAPPLDQRMDALNAAGAREAILVMPDCATRYGGSQYLDSTATGRYATHLVAELVPWIDSRYRTLAARDHRGVAGKSSGGYGALVHGMTHADVFGAVACHSGDMLFDYCYRGDIPKFCTRLQQGGGLTAWLAAFESAPHKKHEDLEALNILAMAAAYSPNPAAPLGIDLPCDLETGAFRDQVWARWLEHDPLRMAGRHRDALASLRLLYLDCGTRDEFHLHHGLRQMRRTLDALTVPYRAEEFDDGHMNVGYRYETSLPLLAAALAP
ncbi:MAG: esterase [Candidatus Eisenbacteria bacterium]|nr:esterase [Candidatus Eisenbacteria bacterium]